MGQVTMAVRHNIHFADRLRMFYAIEQALGRRFVDNTIADKGCPDAGLCQGI